MAVTDFEATDATCGFEYQWVFSNGTNGTSFGVEILLSLTITSRCGFSWSRSSIFYMQTWLCSDPYIYFNLTTNLCQNNCSDAHSEGHNNVTYTCTLLPCQVVCLNCSNNGSINFCSQCDTSLNYVLQNGSCVCATGFAHTGDSCEEICGDGILVYHVCDDGNTADGDGCSSNCTVELYYTCPGGSINSTSVCSEWCGDGLILNHECDDGNTVSGDGCNSTCFIEADFTCNTIYSPTRCT